MKRKKLYNGCIAPFLAGAFLFLAAIAAPLDMPFPKKEAIIPVASAAGISEKLPRGVRVDGVQVGGMSRKKASRILRALLIEKVPALTVKTPTGEYVFSYPQIGFSDNLEEILFSAEKNGDYRTEITYFLNGEREQVEFICANNRKTALDAEVRFSSEGFVYEKESEGIFCDRRQLLSDIRASLKGEITGDKMPQFKTVTLAVKKIPPERTEVAAKNDTRKISSFTTYFNADDRGRSANIALAAERLDGKTIYPDEEFSFNATVGARTKENGFQEAKIIQSGEFIVGTGGGVCQASTTLYNAAVLAGLKVTARKPHSLAVHYVKPSRDAMVSSSSDFRFRNPYRYPVYLSAKVKGDAITVTFYGRDTGYRYEIVSQVTGEIPPPDPIERTGDIEGVIREGKAGIKSEAYLETYFGGKLIKREKLRTDVYAPIRGIVGKKNDLKKETQKFL